MKIATFNINNINKRLDQLLTWLERAEPDVVCLQELKCTQREFPVAAIEKAGYGAVWRGQPTWNGVAMLARGATPVLTRDELPGDPTDTQSRYIEAAVNGTLIAGLYAPNGNPQPGPKFDYKLGWHKRLNRHARNLLDAGVPVVLAGDFNVAPSPADVYATHSYGDNALVQPESRKLFEQLVRQGWTDAVRAAFPDDTVFTFWDYRRSRFERNAGLRLDHIMLSPDLAARLAEVGIDRDVRGEPNASDHAPVWVELNAG
jgi:exodeoxyribonuclease-3